MRFAIIFVSAGITLAATIPLAWAAGQISPAGSAVSWSQGQGSVWQGRLVNVAAGQQLIGDAALSLRPVKLLAGGLSYRVDLSGPVAEGRGRVTLESQSIAVDNANFVARIEHLIGLNATVRAAGGQVRAQSVSIELDRRLRCVRATGLIATEFLANLGAQFGEELPELEGELTCVAGISRIALQGNVTGGVNVSINADIAIGATSSLDARVSGAGGEFAQALVALGFTTEQGDFVYTRELDT